MADEQWYYSDGGQRKGPVGLEAVRALADADVILGDTLVWREGMADWEPAFRHIPGMLPPAPAPAPGLAGRRRAGVGSEPSNRGGGRDYHESVGMAEATRRFFGRYVDFAGRSNRGEYWWWSLANLIIVAALVTVEVSVLGSEGSGLGVLGGLWSLATFLPSLAIMVRRLHDTDRSGWWMLIGLVPLLGVILLLVWFCQRGSAEPNRFG